MTPPIISLEFDRELRRLDPMQEVAQLSLEIDHLGNPALARRLLQRYCQLTGESIGAGELWFYLSHNATTRAKLAAWHVGDPQFPDPRPWLRRAERYLRQALLAIQFAQRATPPRPARATSLDARRRGNLAVTAPVAANAPAAP